MTSRAVGDVPSELVDRIPNVDTRLMIGGIVDGYESYEEAVGAQPATPLGDERSGMDLLYSSGTTGRPKGVKVPLPDAAADTPSSVQLLGLALYGFNPDMVYLSPAPLYHAAPLRFTMAVHRVGGTVIAMEHFDPAEYLRLIEQHKVTHTQFVPTMFVRMLKLPEARTHATTCQPRRSASTPRPRARSR